MKNKQKYFVSYIFQKTSQSYSEFILRFAAESESKHYPRSLVSKNLVLYHVFIIIGVRNGVLWISIIIHFGYKLDK
jgi:hypothetical protein